MTLNHFEEEYRLAVDEEMPKFQLDAQKLQGGLELRRMRKLWERKMAVRGGSAAAVLFLLSAGVAGANYYRSAAIEMRRDGYVVTGGEDAESALPMAEAAEEGLEAYAGGASGRGAVAPPTAYAAEGDSGEGQSTGNREAYTISEKRKDGVSAEACQDLAETEKTRAWEYGSLERFLEDFPLLAQIPDLTLLEKELKGAEVLATEDEATIFIRVAKDDKSFCLTQSDYGDKSFSAAAAYGGENRNERNLSNEQGLSYTVFDTVGQEGEIESTHAVIFVEGWELSMDFWGFEPEAVDGTLKGLGLDLYFK